MRVEVYMMQQLIEEWLPAAEMNNDFRRRFNDMFNIEAPGWLGPMTPDKWWDRWLHETYEDAKQLIKEGELEG